MMLLTIDLLCKDTFGNTVEISSIHSVNKGFWIWNKSVVGVMCMASCLL